MGFLDLLTKKAPEIREKAADLAATHHDTIEQGIDKAADAAKKATKGKYDGQIADAADKAKDGVARLAEGGRT